MVDQIRVPRPPHKYSPVGEPTTPQQPAPVENIFPIPEELPTMPAAPDLSEFAVPQPAQRQAVEQPLPTVHELPTMPLPAAEMPTLKMSEQATIVKNDSEAATEIHQESATERMPERQEMLQQRQRAIEEAPAIAEFFDTGEPMDIIAQEVAEATQSEAVESAVYQRFTAALSSVWETTKKAAAGMGEVFSTGYGDGTQRELRRAEAKSATFFAAFGTMFLGAALLDGKIPGPGAVVDAMQGSELSYTPPTVAAMNQKNAELQAMRPPQPIVQQDVEGPLNLGANRQVAEPVQQSTPAPQQQVQQRRAPRRATSARRAAKQARMAQLQAMQDKLNGRQDVRNQLAQVEQSLDTDQ